MEKKRAMTTSNQSSLVEMDAGRRPESISTRKSSPTPASSAGIPDPEVSAKAVRRQYPGEYNLKILKEAETCALSGQIGALLRREWLYSSHLTTWRIRGQVSV